MADDGERYLPESSFLRMLIDDAVPLSGSAFADANLERLIELTRDADRSNRDWAALLLSQTDFMTPAVCAALTAALTDEDQSVRLEALIGVAKRDRLQALPRVIEMLRHDTIQLLAIEAASFVADPELLPLLRVIKEGWSDDDDFFAAMLNEAIASCTSSTPPKWRSD